MPIEITMPRLSDTMEQGTVIKWHVAEGDEISSGQVIADIETDKATMELEAFDDGVMAKLAASEGDTVDVGAVIAVLAEEGEDVEQAAASLGKGGAKGDQKQQADKSKKKAEDGEENDRADDRERETATATANGAAGGASAPAEEHAAESNGRTEPASGDRVFASPLARKIAGERGIDLSRITGSGPSGRIIRKDVEAYAETADREEAPAASGAAAAHAPAPLPPEGAELERRSVAVSGMRATIAKRLVESKSTLPHYYVTMTVDMQELEQLRKQLNAQLETQGVKLSVNDFVIRACALAMHQHPYVNSQWKTGENGKATIELMDRVNVGMAIALPREGGGLVVATIRDADRVGLRHISSEAKRLAKKAREKGLSNEDMEGSTFAVSNLGMFGVSRFTAIINPPNVCILAVGGAVERPVVRGGEIVPGLEMDMTLSSDHRVVDGAMAAQYLKTVKELLESPAALLV